MRESNALVSCATPITNSPAGNTFVYGLVPIHGDEHWNPLMAWVLTDPGAKELGSSVLYGRE